MKDLFDVHCHMVPGVDDGASDLEESLAMLKMEYRDGVRNIIVTPHYRRRMFETPAKKVHEQFQKLQEAAKKEYPDLSLYLGCELHSNMDLQEILEKLKTERKEIPAIPEEEQGHEEDPPDLTGLIDPEQQDNQNDERRCSVGCCVPSLVS